MVYEGFPHYGGIAGHDMEALARHRIEGSDRLELALRIESDRMVNSIFDPDEVASERTVIISEREGGENHPTFHLGEEVNAAAFKVHPYGQGVIGWKSDLQSITTRAVRYDSQSHGKVVWECSG